MFWPAFCISNSKQHPKAMGQKLFTLILAVCLAMLPVLGQQRTAAEYEDEIAHLRSQLLTVINNAQKSLDESDVEITKVAQRVRVLEKENYQLKTKAQQQLELETAQRLKVTKKLEEVEKERARIDSENTLLAQRVASLEGEIRAGRIQMQHREAEIKKELKSRTEQIEVQLGALRSSQEKMKAESDELRRTAQMASVQAAELERERSQLKKEISHLAEGKIEERSKLELALAEAEANIQSKKAAQLEYRQRIDSLKYELDGMGRVVSVLTHMDRIERKRLARVEQLERELAEAEINMNAERILLQQRTKELVRREAELAAKQQRYGEIRTREAALKMLEARLRAEASLSPSR
jgi:DNA repair exonuclease SbcCD ATPase subunit